MGKEKNLGKCRGAESSEVLVQVQERRIWVSRLPQSLKCVWILTLRQLSSETDVEWQRWDDWHGDEETRKRGEKGCAAPLAPP